MRRVSLKLREREKVTRMVTRITRLFFPCIANLYVRIRQSVFTNSYATSTMAPVGAARAARAPHPAYSAPTPPVFATAMSSLTIPLLDIPGTLSVEDAKLGVMSRICTLVLTTSIGVVAAATPAPAPEEELPAAAIAGAEAVDAFSQEWRGEQVWAHPPPALLLQLVQLITDHERKL